MNRVKRSLMVLFYRSCHVFFLLVMAVLFPVRSFGTRSVPKTGPLLVVANHQSYFDPILIGMTLPRHPRYIARSTLFWFPPFRWAILALGAIPINQEGPATEGVKASLDHLRSGGVLVVWPEGSRTPDGKLGPILPGILLLLKRARVPVVVAGVMGAFESWPIGRASIRPTPICVHYTRWHYEPESPREANLASLAQAFRDEMTKSDQMRRRLLAMGRGSFYQRLF